MLHAARIRKLYLYRAGISKAEIARRSKLPRTSVRRVPCHGFFPEVGRATRYARLPKAHDTALERADRAIVPEIRIYTSGTRKNALKKGVLIRLTKHKKRCVMRCYHITQQGGAILC